MVPNVTPEDLEALLREIKAPDAESMARSEIEEGIPQLAIFLFLKLATSTIDDIRDASHLREMLRRSGGREPGEALRRMVDCDNAATDLLKIVRSALRCYLLDICFLLDDTAAIRFAGWPRAADLEKMHWGVFRIDETGRPIAQMSGLHENLPQFLVPDC